MQDCAGLAGLLLLFHAMVCQACMQPCFKNDLAMTANYKGQIGTEVFVMPLHEELA